MQSGAYLYRQRQNLPNPINKEINAFKNAKVMKEFKINSKFSVFEKIYEMSIDWCMNKELINIVQIV